ncbi:MAG: glycosyltransferase family 4 protein [Alphaproteobacteria bacterium]|jgi:glycosyltransferase involved in cell wall biosynthesis|nr:glycosyltransferase family 4 protein [Alphaproteobacteria bacterium]
MTRRGGRAAILVKGYPRLSETFIAQEILGLERRGLDAEIVSLRHPTDQKRHPVHEAIKAPVRYLPEYLYQEPGRVLRGLLAGIRRPGFGRALSAFLKDWWRDRTPNRGRRFGQALVLAHELDPRIDFLYVHFLHTPASVARYTALLTGLPWAASAHARDIWTSPDWEKREKLAELDWLVTCTAVGAEHLASLAPAGKVSLVYHGLDLARFAPAPWREAGADGSDPERPVTILSVGRLVAKKGYDDLLDALARLPAPLAWRFVHIGGGPLKDALSAQAERLGLSGRIDWRGAQAQGAVLGALRQADLFVLASREDGDGDRDGLPNVLMEAQSQALACLATRFSGIPELIRDGETGMLVPPGDPPALAEGLARMIADPALRLRLGRAGERRVRQDFDMNRGLDLIAARLGLAS